ncbi:hypothetical protein EB061_08185, partial [bacterium]|nr:hypothetical protein [bacterium]
MMFEKFDPISGSATPENTKFIPVSSLEEVAVHLRDDDEEGRYEHYLVQIRHPAAGSASAETRGASLMPPPFTPRAKAEDSAPVPGFKAEKDDIPYLQENADLLLEAGEIHLARNVYRAILRSGEASDIAYAGLAACSDREGLIDQAIQFAWDSVAFAPNKKGYQ